MVIAFLISLAGIWGALMVVGIFATVFWNAFAQRVLHGKGLLIYTRRRLELANAVLSLVINIVIFIVATHNNTY